MTILWSYRYHFVLCASKMVSTISGLSLTKHDGKERHKKRTHTEHTEDFGVKKTTHKSTSAGFEEMAPLCTSWGWGCLAHQAPKPSTKKTQLNQLNRSTIRTQVQEMLHICKRHHKIVRKVLRQSVFEALPQLCKNCRSTLCHAAPREISSAFVASEMYQTNCFSNHFSNRCENVTLRHTWKFHRKSWESCCWNAFCRKECQTKRRQWSEPFLPCDFEQKCEVVKSEKKKTWFSHTVFAVSVWLFCCTLYHLSLLSLLLRISCIFHVEPYTGALQRLHRTPFLTQLSLLHLGPGKPAAVQGGFSNHLTISTYQGSLAAAEADLRLSFHIWPTACCSLESWQVFHEPLQFQQLFLWNSQQVVAFLQRDIRDAEASLGTVSWRKHWLEHWTKRQAWAMSAPHLLGCFDMELLKFKKCWIKDLLKSEKTFASRKVRVILIFHPIPLQFEPYESVRWRPWISKRSSVELQPHYGFLVRRVECYSAEMTEMWLWHSMVFRVAPFSLGCCLTRYELGSSLLQICCSCELKDGNMK